MERWDYLQLFVKWNSQSKKMVRTLDASANEMYGEHLERENMEIFKILGADGWELFDVTPTQYTIGATTWRGGYGGGWQELETLTTRNVMYRFKRRY